MKTADVEDIMELIGTAAAKQLAAERRAVEHRLLDGENEVMVPYPGGSQKKLLYKVPGWFAQPYNRLRVEWRRFKHRRKLMSAGYPTIEQVQEATDVYQVLRWNLKLPGPADDYQVEVIKAVVAKLGELREQDNDAYVRAHKQLTRRPEDWD